MSHLMFSFLKVETYLKRKKNVIKSFVKLYYYIKKFIKSFIHKRVAEKNKTKIATENGGELQSSKILSPKHV